MDSATSPPSPPALPLIGHVFAFLSDKTGFLEHCHQNYGDVVKLQIGEPTLLCNSPEDVNHILVNNAHNYEKTPKLTSERGRALSGSGLHTATGDAHLPLRRMIQPLFHQRMVEKHCQAMDRLVDQELSCWKSGDVIDLLDVMMRLTQKIMITTLFGNSFIDEDQQFARSVSWRRKYTQHFFTSNLPMSEYLPLPVNWRYRSARNYMHEVIQKQIDTRRKTDQGDHDFLSLLMRSRSRDGKPFSDRQLHDECMTLTSTGYETIGSALAWAGHLLAIHPGTQERIREEARKIKPLSSAQAKDFLQLDLGGRVFNETLRLYPPTWIIVRVASKDDTLPGGTAIKAGDKIWLCPFTMHRHPRIYQNPGSFDPERWLPDVAKLRPRLAFYPFGAGTRLCIGEPFARLEFMVIMTRIAQRFYLEPIQQGEVEVYPSIVLEPRGGVQLRLR